MDAQRDYEPFKRLVTRMAVALDKFASEELIESWWKALRNIDLDFVERRVDEYLAKAGEKTPFPRPGQFRPKDAPLPGDAGGQDFTRDYWRSEIVHEVSHSLGLTFAEFEPVLARSPELIRSMRELLDELCQQERESTRTMGMHVGCARRARRIAQTCAAVREVPQLFPEEEAFA